MNFRTISISAVFLILGVIVGFLFFQFINKDKSVLGSSTKPCQYEYLNVLRCDPESNIKSKEYTVLRNEIIDYIQEQQSKKTVTNVSVFFRDLREGSTMSINAQESFSPASLLKVPLLITYYKKAESDPSVLTRKFALSGKLDSNPQNIKPQKSVIAGQNYTINELLDLLITQSDNLAWEALISDLRQNYSEEDFVETLSDVGIIDPRKKHEEQYITTQAYASIFRVLYNSSYLNMEMSNKALDLLTHSVFKDGLVAGIPEGIKVAHKFGEQSYDDIRQLHDCGIIYYEKNPYLLCVMTQGDNLEELKPVIREISKKVYEEVSSRN